MSVSMGPGESTPMIAAREGVSVSMSYVEEKTPEVIYQRASLWSSGGKYDRTDETLDKTQWVVGQGIANMLPGGAGLAVGTTAAGALIPPPDGSGPPNTSGGISRPDKMPTSHPDFHNINQDEIDKQRLIDNGL